jgi:hypothetical protein
VVVLQEQLSNYTTLVMTNQNANLSGVTNAVMDIAAEVLISIMDTYSFSGLEGVAVSGSGSPISALIPAINTATLIVRFSIHYVFLNIHI